MSYTPTPFDQYTTFGLAEAQNLFNQAKSNVPVYPAFVSQASQAPVKMDFYDYQPSQAMQQLAAPNYSASGGPYKGLMGGDYARLEQALALPGQLAAQQAYEAGLRSLDERFGGRGLYGSSIMGREANEGLMREYLNALASNAANATAKRYSMEQAELQNLNQYNLTREQQQNQFAQQGFQTGAAHAADIFKANQSEAQRKQAYDAAKQQYAYQIANMIRDWQNAQAYELFTYNLAKQAFDQQQIEAQMNRALAIAGQGSPLSQSYLNYQIAQQQAQAARDAANAQARAATTAAWAEAAGAAAGGLLSGNLGSDLWKWITG